jgi:hypothetical protein
MELKDVILSTLAEMETGEAGHASEKESPPAKAFLSDAAAQDKTHGFPLERSDELQFLQNVRERLLVLFEGFQAPNNAAVEAKVDLTLNFLEYLLAAIDTRINTMTTKEEE